LAGDELALETLGEAITARGFTPEHVRSAIQTLKSLSERSVRTDVVLGARWGEPFEWGPAMAKPRTEPRTAPDTARKSKATATRAARKRAEAVTPAPETVAEAAPAPAKSKRPRPRRRRRRRRRPRSRPRRRRRPRLRHAFARWSSSSRRPSPAR
jgi:hypothetical protein